jgi:hypothetical protein
MIQRKTPLKRGTSQLKRTPLRKVSKKRAKDGKIYSAKRKAFLESHPICQVWLAEHAAQVFRELIMDGEAMIYTKYRSTDIHHMAKRTGSNYLDESTWLAVCRENHDRIHNNPAWARANGFLK